MSATTTEPPRQATNLAAGETRILIPRVPWKLYEAFVQMLPESPPVRAAFDGRSMEIVAKGPVHGHFGLSDQAHGGDDLGAS
jgi:hypothetical protein